MKIKTFNKSLNGTAYSRPLILSLENMKFRLPHQQIEFEIPNEWWVAVGMVSCRPIAVSYTATSDPCYPKTIVPISELEVTVRNKGAAWLQKERMVQILKGFRTGDVLLPIEVDEPPTRTNLRYRVHDGFHRFFPSDK